MFNHRPCGRETQRVRVAVRSRRFLPMPLPLLCQSGSRRRPRWPGPGLGLDQGGLDQTLDCWTVDTAKALFWKKAPVDQTWPSTRESSVNFGPGVFGFLARDTKFAESETSFWSKSDKNTWPLIIFSNPPFLSNILFLFMRHQDICIGV